MPWARLDERYPAHRKVRPLSDAAFRLDVSGICWVSEQLTDGRITTDDLPYVSGIRNPEKAAAELVKRGRWHPAGESCGTEHCPASSGTGWMIHDYLAYNPTKAKVLADRAAAADRQKRARDKAAAARKARGHGGDDADTHAGSHSDRHGVTAPVSNGPPDPTRPEGPVVVGRDPSPLQADARDGEPRGELSPESADPLTRLVADVRTIRPAWTDRAVRKAALQAVDDRGKRLDQVRTALVAVAELPDSKAPGRVLHDGPWWSEITVTTPPTIAELYEANPELRPVPPDPDRDQRGIAAARAALAARNGRTEPEEAS